MRVSFRQLNMDEDSLGRPLDVFVDGIVADFTSTIFHPNDTANTFVLPLNPAANSARYDFDFTTGSGTLEVGYRAMETALFTVCGPQTFFSDLSLASTDFDIVKVVKDSIQDPPVTNILLQRCPDTNLVRIAFRESGEEGAADVPMLVTGISADYTAEIFYPDTTVTAVTLPLNDQGDVTRFTIAFENSTTDIEVGYSRTPVVYHKTCNRMQINGVEVISSGFDSPPQVLSDEISFPANSTNIAIIPN